MKIFYNTLIFGDYSLSVPALVGQTRYLSLTREILKKKIEFLIGFFQQLLIKFDNIIVKTENYFSLHS